MKKQGKFHQLIKKACSGYIKESTKQSNNDLSAQGKGKNIKKK